MNKSEGQSGLSAVIPVRPNQVLKIEDGFDEEIRFFMPQASPTGTLTTIESLMLVKLMRVVDATYVFEFGTFKGLTTRLLLANLPEKQVEGPRLFTLDLPSLDGIDFQGSDALLAAEAVHSSRKYQSSDQAHLVEQLLLDCLTLDEQKYLKKFQMIFIDGNHELKYASSDTEKAFAMLADAPSCIVWHDYGHPEFPELTAYIDDLSQSVAIHHIKDTMLAFHLVGRTVGPPNV